MCGIAGYIDPSLQNAERDAMLEGMLQRMLHRGPDARGKYFNEDLALGHNRLSIIDLSPNGNQPMHARDLSIVFNGEIYNYLELKEEIQKLGWVFFSESDTEVVIAAYHHWGHDCVKRFIGMWAFALWDNRKKELFCSRDRFGIKPFYYIREGAKLYFASEYKALKLSPIFRSDLNFNQVARGLQLGWCTYEDETYYSCISQLPAGSNMVFKRDEELSIKTYWQVGSGRYAYTNHDEACFEFRNLLRSAVSLHMRSDVEVAICLSGGVDSSSLTSLIAEIYPGQKVHSFSIYYDGDNEVDERPFMNKVIEKFPQVQPHFYKPEESIVPEYFDQVVDKADVPITGSSPISHYYLIKKIHEAGIKVVLDGQGADEYLAGYVTAYYRRMADLLGSFNLGKAFGMLSSVSENLGMNQKDRIKFLGKSVLSLLNSEQKLYSLEFNKYYPFLVRKEFLRPNPVKIHEFGKSRLDSYLCNSLCYTSLPTILHYVDRMTMSFSVESRVPLLDHRLVDFAFSLPDREKINGAQTKSILRESLKDILPTSIYNRKDKKGFSTPGENKWLRGSLGWLLDINYNKLSFLDATIAKSVIENYKKGNDKYSRLVWRLALLNYWINNNA